MTNFVPDARPEQVHAVLDGGDHERPEQRRDHAADAAEEARAADDRSGDDEQKQVPTARPGSDRPEPGGQNDPTDARHEAADHEDGDADPIDVDAGAAGRLRAAADRVDVTAEARPPGDERPEDEEDDEDDGRRERRGPCSAYQTAAKVTTARPRT